MNDLHLQLFLAIIMLITTLLAGLSPLKIFRRIRLNSQFNRRTSWALTLLSCFAGGVFLSTCFLDLIPHVNSKYQKFVEKLEYKSKYPFPELFACVGFFLVYFIEEILGMLLSSRSTCPHRNIASMNTDVIRNRVAKSEEFADFSTSLVYEASDQVTDRGTKNVKDEITNENGGIMRSATFAAAMSFHSVLEGIALGVQDDKSGILTLFVSLIIHKGIEAFSVGLHICKSNPGHVKMVLITILVYCVMTPIGSLIGIFINNANMDILIREGLVILLEALAVGTFIYVTFFEVIAAEKANEFSNLVQLIAIIIGFSTIAVLQYIEILLEVHSHT